MKRIITAITLSLGLLVSGAAVAAPAQAVVGSTAYFAAADSGISPKPVLRVTNTSGTTRNITLGGRVSNTFRVCPVGLAFRIQYKNPAGNWGLLAKGQCLSPTMRGEYKIGARS